MSTGQKSVNIVMAFNILMIAKERRAAIDIAAAMAQKAVGPVGS